MRGKWRYENFAYENNAVKEITRNLINHPFIAMKYCTDRYNKYMFRGLFPRAVENLDRAELQKLTMLYVNTLNEIEARFDTAVPLGPTFRLSIWCYMHKWRYLTVGFLLRPIHILCQVFFKNYKILTLKHFLQKIKGKVTLEIKSKLLDKLNPCRIRLPKKNRYRRALENIESLGEYNLKSGRWNKSIPEKGLSAMLRVKNEEAGIRRCIHSIIELCDEVVLIDNNSHDKTVEIVRQIMLHHPYGHKIKLYQYPFLVARCGSEHNATAESSVHSLAYYYNWCLDRCSYKAVIKWDADMVLGQETDGRALFKKLVNQVLESTIISAVEFKTQSYYALDENEGFLADGEKHRETRIFTNSPNIFFVKAGNFEELTFISPVKFIRNDNIFSFEIKRLWEDEFSHWSDLSFSTNRKVKEFRSFNRLKLSGRDNPPPDYHLTKFSML